LYGGPGADTFVFDNLDGGVDQIGSGGLYGSDFDGDGDVIALSLSIFGEIGAVGSAMDATAFNSSYGMGAYGASTAAHRVLYDTQDGALYYDADGYGAIAAVQFATIADAVTPILTEADFMVIA